jgi:hypothetical protein
LRRIEERRFLHDDYFAKYGEDKPLAKLIGDVRSIQQLAEWQALDLAICRSLSRLLKHDLVALATIRSNKGNNSFMREQSELLFAVNATLGHCRALSLEFQLVSSLFFFIPVLVSLSFSIKEDMECGTAFRAKFSGLQQRGSCETCRTSLNHYNLYFAFRRRTSSSDHIPGRIHRVV